MDFRNFTDSLDCLGINQNLSDLIESERNLLMNIFAIKEKIDEKLDDLEKNGLKTKQKELYDNLCSANDLLFTEFYKRYCGNRFPSDVVKEGVVSQVLEETGDDIDGSTFDDFSVVDEYVRFNLGKLLFDSVKKEDIHLILGPSISKNVDLSELFKTLIEQYFDEKKYIIINYSKEYKNREKFSKIFGDKKLLFELNEKILDGFKKSYVEFVASAIDSGLKDNPHADFDVLVKIINVVLLLFFEKEKFLQGYSVFSEKIGGNVEDLIFDNDNVNVVHNKVFDDPQFIDDDTVKPHDYERLYSNLKSIFSSFGKKCELDLDDVDIDFIEGESYKCFFAFIRRFFKELNLRELYEFGESLRSFDEERIINNAEGAFSKHRKKIFTFWKQHFISELNKYIINKDDLIVSSEEEKQFIDEMFQKYPNAKKYSGNISRSKREQLKSEFIDKWSDYIVNVVNNVVADNSEFFGELSLQDLFMFEQLSKLFFEGEKKSLLLKYKEYIFSFIEDNFVKSHGKAVMKEDNKTNSALQPEKKVQEGKNYISEKSGEIAVNKKKLPEGLVSDLERYFGGTIDPVLERSLRNSGGVYKTSWFDKFGVDDGFFEILNRFGFFCEDLPEEETDDDFVNTDGLNINSIGDSQSDSDSEVDDNFSKLRNLIDKIKSTEVIDDKVDYYIQAFEIFYDINDIKLFKSQILASIKCDIRILKGIESVLEKILKGQKEELKTSKNWKKRYFTFDVAYNTGYRIVLNGQQGKSRKIIIDFVDHDTYSDRIPSYYCKY